MQQRTRADLATPERLGDVVARVNTPMPEPELRRRWSELRAAMDAQDIDVLIASANNDYMGGYVKYLSDEPAVMGYRLSVVFPRSDSPVLLRHGPSGPGRKVLPGDTALWRGPGTLRQVPSFATVHYTDSYEADVIIEAIHGLSGVRRIGLLGLNQISSSTLKRVREALRGAEFVNCSEMVDDIKVVKSADEVRFIRATAAIQDAVMAEIAADIRPGVRESDVTAKARWLSEQMGSEQGTYLCGSGAPGEGHHLATRHYQNRQLRKGDLFYVLLEANGPGGYYAQLGRTFSLGRPSEQVLGEYSFALDAQDFTLSQLKPGASCRQIWRQYNGFHDQHGRRNDEANRLHCHGQGYDIVEPPLIRPDEDRVVTAGMYMASHPVHTTNGTVSWLSENILISDQGAELIHNYPREIANVG